VILTKAQILSMANEMQSGDPLNPATFETFGRGSTFQLLDAEIGRDGAVTMQRGVDDEGPFYHQRLFDEGADVQVWPKVRKGTWR
jgi:hypothetical protein